MFKINIVWKTKNAKGPADPKEKNILTTHSVQMQKEAYQSFITALSAHDVHLVLLIVLIPKIDPSAKPFILISFVLHYLSSNVLMNL